MSEIVMIIIGLLFFDAVILRVLRNMDSLLGIPNPLSPKIFCAWCGHIPWVVISTNPTPKVEVHLAPLGTTPKVLRTPLGSLIWVLWGRLSPVIWPGWNNPNNMFRKSFWKKDDPEEPKVPEKPRTRTPWGMRVVTGGPTEFFWQYRNKDGTPDRRHVDNYQQATYRSEWQCNVCGAITGGRSYLVKKPSIRKKLWRINLLSDGQGERIAKDWESKGLKFQNPDEAYRRSDDS